MECGRILCILVFITAVHAKVFTRCQLTRELLKNGVSRTFISNWVCLIEKESDKNTSALIAKTPKKKYYGLFQIGSEYCKEGKQGGICDITCESLLDEDLKNDLPCAMTIFETQGFKYWPKWESRCKGQMLPDIEKCPDWQHPPIRASPPRDKRMIVGRGKREIIGLGRPIRKANRKSHRKNRNSNKY